MTSRSIDADFDFKSKNKLRISDFEIMIIALNKTGVFLGGVFAVILLSSTLVAQQTVAYVDANIETASKAGAIQDGILIVKDGKISAIGKDIKIPNEAKVVSLAGKTVLPGMVDPYYVYSRSSSASSFRTVVVNGRTFRIPNNRPSPTSSAFTKVGEYFYPHDLNFKTAIRTGITTSNFVTSGRGLSAFANLDPEAGEKMLFQSSGLLFAQVSNSTSSLDTVRKELLKAKPKTETKTEAKAETKTASKTSKTKSSSTTSSKTSTSKTAKVDPVTEAWNSVREGKTSLVINVNNSATISFLLNTVKDLDKVKIVLISSGANLYELLDEIAKNKNVSVVVQPTIDTVPYTNLKMNMPKMLVEKEIPFGISMSLNSGQMASSVTDPMFPIAMLVKTGLDRQKAIEAVTLKPAKMLGLEKTHGSLEAGKSADFLIFDGDPLSGGAILEKVILKGSATYEN